MASVQRHHPEWDRFVLLVGENGRESGVWESGVGRKSFAPTPDSTRSDEPFTTVPLEELPLPNPRQFCFRYTLLELNTAVKPWMFEHLFERGYDRVIYLDPDIVVYSPLVGARSRSI